MTPEQDQVQTAYVEAFTGGVLIAVGGKALVLPANIRELKRHLLSFAFVAGETTARSEILVVRMRDWKPNHVETLGDTGASVQWVPENNLLHIEGGAFASAALI